MVKVSIEVRSGAARFYVALRAHSFQRAISRAGALFEGYPQGEVPDGARGLLRRSHGCGKDGWPRGWGKGGSMRSVRL